MEIAKKFERIQQDIVVLEKDLLQDLNRLLKVDFSTIDQDPESLAKDRLIRFLNKSYDFSKYNDFLTELIQDIDNLEESSKGFIENTEMLRSTKQEYEIRKGELTNTNYDLGLIRENCLAEVKSLNRELQMSVNLTEELGQKIYEEDNRQKRKIAEINKLNMEIQNIKHRSVAQTSLLKKAEIEREMQMTRLNKRMAELADIAETEHREFEEKMEQREMLVQDLQRKIVLIDKEIELLKDMESLKASDIR